MNAKNYAWFYLLLITLTGCTLFDTPPADTFNKKVALVELGYIQALRTVKEYQTLGLIKPADQAHIDEFIDNMRISLDTMYLAKGMGDLTTAEGQLKVATTALDALKKYLISKEQAK